MNNRSNWEKNWATFRNCFGPILKERKIGLYDLLQFLWQISNDRPILLLVDEIGKAKFKYLIPSLNSLRMQDPQKFLPFYSALNPDYLKDHPVWEMPLFGRKIEAVEPLFLHKIQILKVNLSDKDIKLLKRCIAFCNGHMRTLEALYTAFFSNSNLTNMEFDSIAQQTFLKLQNLVKTLPIVDAEDAKTGILGRCTNMLNLISSIPNTTYSEALVQGYFFHNSEEAYIFVPKLTPFALYWVITHS